MKLNTAVDPAAGASHPSLIAPALIAQVIAAAASARLSEEQFTQVALVSG